ncbi:MAG: hypothetical protein ACQERZ_00380 [Fusobacteriota bacterium]
MEKIIVNCPSCNKKMKISNKLATYKCPHCNEKYKYTKSRKMIEKTKRIFKDGAKLIPVLSKKISNSFKNLYKLIKQKFKK